MLPAQVDSRAIPVAGHGVAIREARVAQDTGPPSGTDDFPPDYRMPLSNHVRPDSGRCWRALRSALSRLPFQRFDREAASYGTAAHILTASQIRADKAYQN